MKYLYFSAPWCEPCKVLGPTMAKVEEENIPVDEINVDEDTSSDLVAEYSIRNIPRVILVNDLGEELTRIIRVQPVSYYIKKYNSFNNKEELV
jgi:thiol-disulfide isomerase/thioredoxin